MVPVYAAIVLFLGDRLHGLVDAPSRGVDVEAKAQKDVVEQQRVLHAVAAATAGYRLVEDGGGIGADCRFGRVMESQILERDMRELVSLQS